MPLPRLDSKESAIIFTFEAISNNHSALMPSQFSSPFLRRTAIHRKENKLLQLFYCDDLVFLLPFRVRHEGFGRFSRPLLEDKAGKPAWIALSKMYG